MSQTKTALECCLLRLKTRLQHLILRQPAFMSQCSLRALGPELSARARSDEADKAALLLERRNITGKVE